MKVVSGLGATGKISSPPKGGTTVKILFPFGPPFGCTWNFASRFETRDYFHSMAWSIQNSNLTLNSFEEFLRLFRDDFPDCVTDGTIFPNGCSVSPYRPSVSNNGWNKFPYGPSIRSVLVDETPYRRTSLMYFQVKPTTVTLPKLILIDLKYLHT